jgi:hypothetical protein
MKRKLPINGLAMSSAVLGGITLLVSFIPFVNFFAILLGVIGVLFAVLGLRQIRREPERMRGVPRAIAGLLLNGLGLAVVFLTLYKLLGG